MITVFYLTWNIQVMFEVCPIIPRGPTTSFHTLVFPRSSLPPSALPWTIFERQTKYEYVMVGAWLQTLMGELRIGMLLVTDCP